MSTNVVVKLLGGEEKLGSLARIIHAGSETVELIGEGGGAVESYRIDEIAFIKFLGKPEAAGISDRNLAFEEVTAVTGEHFRLRLKPNQSLPGGFYGYPIDPDCDFRAVFVSNAGLRQRHGYQPLGDILTKTGVIAPEQIDAALSQQKRLRTRRVGEILAEQHNIAQVTVEEALDSAQKSPRNYRIIKVGEILIDAGLVTRQQVDEALAIQSADKRKRIGTILVELGLISEEQLLSALAQKFGLQVVDLEHFTPTPEALNCLPTETLEKMQVLPLTIRNNRLVVATSNPTDPAVAQDLRFAANCPVELVVASSGQIAAQITRVAEARSPRIEELIGGLDHLEVTVEEEQEPDKVTESDSKVISLVNKVLLDAHRRGVSDIHFEPGMGSLPLIIRYRRDGICSRVHKVAATYKAAILSRLKIIAKLDIAEHRRPQSGKILLKHGHERIEYRVEITPTIGGQEDAVLRVLSNACIYPLDQVGFSTRNLELMRSVLKKPYGMILCVGPTGSGKTTTLHSCIAEINTPERKIWTAEDPVEITQEGLRQVQVHSKIGFTFEEALRSFLRADPDVIMIGEMRDLVTAKTAIGASLTGHLVFSTLHTNSAPETVVRLIEMGLDPFNFADAMLTIVAQRLARRLCNHCKQAYHPGRDEYDELVKAYGPEQYQLDRLPGFSAELTLMRARGCQKCGGLGYGGRIALHEQLVNSPEIRLAIKQSAGIEKLRQIAVAQGMATLRMDGIQKVLLGLTDMAQVNRVVV